jgi:hypothetical protein
MYGHAHAHKPTMEHIKNVNIYIGLIVILYLIAMPCRHLPP